MDRTLILYTRANCHLCEEAKAEVRSLFGGRLRVEEIDVDADPALAARFGEEVPVGFLDGEKVFKFRLDPRRLRRLLRRAERGGGGGEDGGGAEEGGDV